MQKLKERENSKKKKINKTDYKRLIGSLLHVSAKTRPDNCICSKSSYKNFSENPTEVDLNACIQILKYLKSSMEYSIH